MSKSVSGALRSSARRGQTVVDVEDVLSKAAYVKAILVHREQHPEPMSGGNFAERMDYNKEDAGKRRRELEALGVLVLWNEDLGDNRIPTLLSRLTPEGVRIGDALLQANEEAAKARKRKEREKHR